jgi:2-polyprenyl-3-methyl-5-hydroxy-6-metoxy-1,4-benzoquinol methylase
MTRAYQYDFSDSNDAMFEQRERRKKADTMLAVLADNFRSGPESLTVLTVGCSAGFIEARLAEKVGSVVGIDIDEAAIDFARQTHSRENLSFELGDAMDLRFSADTFDVVVCSQVYEHVPDAEKMMASIYQVLRPGGVCYFAATSRFCVMEQHYFLPFLSVIPVALAHIYLRVAGKGTYYYERHLSYFGLVRICRAFTRIDYTARLVQQPGRFATTYLVDNSKLKSLAARILLAVGYWVFPGYVWLLRKPEVAPGQSSPRATC